MVTTDLLRAMAADLTVPGRRRNMDVVAAAVRLRALAAALDAIGTERNDLAGSAVRSINEAVIEATRTDAERVVIAAAGAGYSMQVSRASASRNVPTYTGCVPHDVILAAADLGSARIDFVMPDGTPDGWLIARVGAGRVHDIDAVSAGGFADRERERLRQREAACAGG